MFNGRLDMEKDIDSIEPDPVEKQRDLDLFASFISDEMRMEVARLRHEQELFKKEIEQLREERDMLFGLLQNTQSQQSETKAATPIFSFSSQNPISIEGSQRTVDSATQTVEHEEHRGTLFSKELMLKEMSKYQSNKTFHRASSIINHAKSGDAIVKYFTNACGSAITSMEREIALLREELMRAHNRRRMAMADSIRSLTAAKTEQLKLKCAMITGQFEVELQRNTI